MTPALPTPIVLQHGGHEPPNGAFAADLLESAAYLAGEPWGDHPECVCPVLASFGRSWNDALNDEDRQMLVPYIERLVGTRSTPEVESRRSWMATDWLVRECAPAWLRLAGLDEHAHTLEELAALADSSSACSAAPHVVAARAAARAAARDDVTVARDAARDAAETARWTVAGTVAGAAARAAARDAAETARWTVAGAAARDAAGDAAWTAAGAAARAAARAAGWDAARPAARDAAWDAARDAAWDAARNAARSAAGVRTFVPTVRTLQVSALALLDRMIECSVPEPIEHEEGSQ